MRGALVTVVVCLSAAAATFGLGFGVQAGGLTRASEGARVGANVAGLMLRHRLMTSTFTIDGKTETGTCLHHWFPRRNGALGRGSLLQLGSGGLVLENGGPVRLQDLAKPAYLPRLLLETAGCTWDIGARIALAAQLDAVDLRHTVVGGRPALELRLGRIHDPIGHDRYVVDRVRLWVDPKTYAPIAVWASLGGHEGYGRVRFEKVTPDILHRLLSSVRTTRS